MKKNISKKFKLIFVLLFCLLMTACGLKATDNLEIDGNFKGKRVVDILVDAETLEHITGGKTGIKNFLKKNIEAPLKYKIMKEEEKSLNIRLFFEFKDIKDYRAIVEKLYSKSKLKTKPEIDFNTNNSDAAFLQGFLLKDNSDIKEILGYLDDRLVKDKLIKEDQKNQIWNSVVKNVKVDGKAIVKNSYSNINIDETKDLGPLEYFISISKNINSENYNARIRLGFDIEKHKELKSDWKKKLIDTSIIKEKESKQEGSYHIEVFDIENKDLATINKALSQLFGTKAEISISEVFDKNNFEKNFIVKQNIPENKHTKRADYRFVYYMEPMEINTHPLDMNFDSTQSKYIENTTLSAREKKENMPIKFNNLSIKTEIRSKDNLVRTLTIKKEDEDAKLINEFLLPYLDFKTVKYANNDKDIVIKYEGKNFSEENGKLFTSDPYLHYEDKGLYKYNLAYGENSSLIKLDFAKIEYQYSYPSFTKSETKENHIFASTNGYIEANIILKGYKLINIIITVVLVLALVIGAIVTIFVLKKKGIDVKAHVNSFFKKTADKTKEGIATIKATQIVVEKSETADASSNTADLSNAHFSETGEVDEITAILDDLRREVEGEN